MARDYQPRKKNIKYQLPHAVYMSTLWTIRDYDRMKDEQRDILYRSPDAVCGSRRQPGDPTANKAVMLAAASFETDAIDRALNSIPPEYRKGVWRNVVHRDKFPFDAHDSTYKEWRQVFIFRTAAYLRGKAVFETAQ